MGALGTGLLSAALPQSSAKPGSKPAHPLALLTNCGQYFEGDKSYDAARARVQQKVEANNQRLESGPPAALDNMFFRESLDVLLRKVSIRGHFLRQRWAAVANTQILATTPGRARKESLRREMHQRFEQAEKTFQRRLQIEGELLKAETYSQWLKQLDHVAALAHYEEVMSTVYGSYVASLQVISPLIAPEGLSRNDFTAVDLSQIEDFFEPLSIVDAQNRQVLSLNRSTVTYEPSQGTTVLRLERAPQRPIFKLTALPGAGAMTSYSAGYAPVMTNAATYGIDIQAFDLPDALSTAGITLRGIKDPVELLVILSQNIAFLRDPNFTGAHGIVARSAGSLFEFFRLALTHALNKERAAQGLDPLPINSDISVLTSFTNPLYVRAQVQNALDTSGQFEISQGMNTEQLNALIELSDATMRTLNDIIANDAEVFADFGHNILFVMGELDNDAMNTRIPGRDMWDMMHDLQKRYAPKSRLYRLPDALKDFPEIKAKIDIYRDTEAGHMILSPAANYTADTVPKAFKDYEREHGVDLAYLYPRRADQRVEVLALTALSIDHLRGLSELDLVRESEASAFVQFMRNYNASRPTTERIDIGDIFKNRTLPGRVTLIQRLKRALLFVYHNQAPIN